MLYVQHKYCVVVEAGNLRVVRFELCAAHNSMDKSPKTMSSCALSDHSTRISESSRALSENSMKLVHQNYIELCAFGKL